jgi:hypothetical protein
MSFRARWNGEGWELPVRSQIYCAKYKRGDSVWLTELEESSPETRGHYFAVIKKAFDNMPKEWGFLNEQHLRKWCLIECGYCHIEEVVCASEKEARLKADGVILSNRLREDYCIVIAKGNVIRIVTAESQRMKAMGRRRFQDSKQAVIEKLADMLRVTVEQLTEESKKDAA